MEKLTEAQKALLVTLLERAIGEGRIPDEYEEKELNELIEILED
jgi:hypothetical protein